MAKIKELYENAKSAKVGASCKCPSCGTKFVKSNYQQAFCKSKIGTKCKDNYWNTVIPEKKNNSQRAIDKEDRFNNSLEENGNWDEHQCYVERCEWCECIDCRCD